MSRASIKAEAKQNISQTSPHPMLVTAAYFIAMWVISFIASSLGGIGSIASMKISGDGLYYNVPQIAWSSFGLISILGIVLSLVSGILEAGYSQYCLNAMRYHAPGFADLIKPFQIFGKVILLNILVGLKVLAWTLLFVIPGFVAIYRYSMATYILLDNPEMSVMDCISASKTITDGHKMELFVLDLSFIGWDLLCAIPFVILWVQPYRAFTKVRYYGELSNGMFAATNHIHEAVWEES